MKNRTCPTCRLITRARTDEEFPLECPYCGGEWWGKAARNYKRPPYFWKITLLESFDRRMITLTHVATGETVRREFPPWVPWKGWVREKKKTMLTPENAKAAAKYAMKLKKAFLESKDGYVENPP